MKRAHLLLFPLAATLAVLSAGCGASVSTAPPAVQTAAVTRGRLVSNVQVSGKIVPVQYADLFTKVPGRVSAVNVDVGSQVKAGQVLLTLEAGAQAAALQQARAAVAQARAGENAADVSYDTAKANYLRGQALLAQGAISPYTFDNQYRLPYQSDAVAANQTAPAALQAALAGEEAAQAAYDDGILSAPFAGVIAARNINPGGMTSGPPALPGETPLLVEVTLSNPDETLKPGMFAVVTFAEDTAGCLLVPNQAVVRQVAATTVWVVRDNAVVSRTVQLGASDGRETVVDSGLNSGELVVVSGQQGLVQDEKVTVQGP